MSMIAIGGDDLVALGDRHLHAGDHGFLADIEMAEAADIAHAVKLSGFLLEPADQEHEAIGRKLLLGLEPRAPRQVGLTRIAVAKPQIGGAEVQAWRCHGLLTPSHNPRIRPEASTSRKSLERN